MPEKQVFDATAIFDMAVRMEHHGLAFYKAFASKVQDPEIQEVFNFMIEQENKHIEIFSSMKTGLESHDLPESYEGEARSYLDAFVKDQVFYSAQEAEQKAREITDRLSAIDIAVELEKQSILFYSGMKEVVRKSDHENIDLIIEQERNHVRRLLNLKRVSNSSRVKSGAKGEKVDGTVRTDK